MPADAPPPSPSSPEPSVPRRPWGAWLAGCVSCCLLAVSGIGWGVLHGIGHAIDRVDAFGGLHNRPAEDGAQTFLLVGTDDREGIPDDELKHVLHAGGRSCHCTDTMMLVHLSPTRSRATVISIPRDSFVTIPAHTDQATGKPVSAGSGKINAAYGMGGAPLTVQTVEQATGIRIDHYVQVDFRTFVSAVDALGGVEVCTTTPLRDSASGLDLPAGATLLDGVGALKYVRARHLDTDSDLGRMQRQQKLMALLLRGATASGTLLDPARLHRLLTTAVTSVKADAGLSGQDLLALATRLRDMSGARTVFTGVPVAEINHRVPGWGSTVLWDGPAAEALFDAVRSDRTINAGAGGPHSVTTPRRLGDAAAALTVPPRQVRIQVLNGSAVSGLGGRVDRDLRGVGFSTTGLATNATGTAPGTARTVIRYDPRWDESVKTVAAALPGAQLVQVPGLGPVMQVVAGGDYTSAIPVTVSTTHHDRAVCP